MDMNKPITAALVALALVAGSAGAQPAALKVFACEPEWAALVKELAGDGADVYVATTPLQDVHQIQARPSLIARARSADLLVCTGAEIEVGWLPKVLEQAANPRLRPGLPAYFEAFHSVPMREVPSSVDRSLGDIHPYGNPHIQSDPRNIGLVARDLAARLAVVDPAGAPQYAARAADFARRWDAAVARWTARGAPLKGAKFVEHHLDWPYLAAWLGLDIVANLEPKPGLPPSGAHLASLLNELKGHPVKGILRTAYEDAKPSEWLAERIGAPPVLVPQTVGAVPAATDLFTLYDAMLDALLGAGTGAK
jgi:zinc/manganese transport system substrate-binding protein